MWKWIGRLLRKRNLLSIDKCSYISVIDNSNLFSKLDIPSGKEINHKIKFIKIV